MNTSADHLRTAAVRRHTRSELLILTLGFVLAALALWFFAWIAEEMLEGSTAQFDSQVRLFVHAHSTDQLTAVMEFLTLFGSSLVMTPLALLTLILCYIKREIRALKTLAATFAGAVVLELLLKSIFRRARPAPFFHISRPASFSFPSGHALFSFCFFAGLAIVLSPRLARPQFKIALWLTSLAMILGIGFSRIYLGVHYPSDVLAGYAAGLIWVAALGFVESLHRRNLPRKSSLE